jgi:triosephosphate isomerase (TIM)
MRPPLLVGNWKMHGNPNSCVELAQNIAQSLHAQPASAQIAVAPPFTALIPVKQIIENKPVGLAAQNCHWEESGAFTGEISPSMLRQIGCDWVILGHSERRHIFGESDDMVARKVPAVIKHGMRPILCVGETLEQRKTQKTTAVIASQLEAALKGVSEDGIDRIEIAYEPVWAIGTGINASADQIRETHTEIRKFLNSRFGLARGREIRILYGGSVNADNAAMIARIEAVNGVLVGGASLIGESFISIVRTFS